MCIACTERHVTVRPTMEVNANALQLLLQPAVVAPQVNDREEPHVISVSSDEHTATVAGTPS